MSRRASWGGGGADRVEAEEEKGVDAVMDRREDHSFLQRAIQRTRLPAGKRV